MKIHPMYQSDVRLDDKNVVITGANTGIGKETARDLYRRGARVLIASRDLARAEQAKQDIVDSTSTPLGGDASSTTLGSIEIEQLDLASLASVRSFAEKVHSKMDKLHLLINNAGVMACKRMETADGFEMQLGTNHLGHFLLTHLLLDLLKAAAPARIINLSSLAHTRGKMHFDDLMLQNSYGNWKSYYQSKLANVLFTRELAKKLEGTGVTTYAVHPGIVKTELWRHQRFIDKLLRPVYRTAVQGAQTTLFCALAPELQTQNGKYYASNKETAPSRRGRSDADAARLWSISAELVGLSEAGAGDSSNDVQVEDAN